MNKGSIDEKKGGLGRGHFKGGGKEGMRRIWPFVDRMGLTMRLGDYNEKERKESITGPQSQS